MRQWLRSQEVGKLLFNGRRLWGLESGASRRFYKREPHDQRTVVNCGVDGERAPPLTPSKPDRRESVRQLLPGGLPRANSPMQSAA